MNADDPRHGTRRGYYAHRKDGEQACAPCKRAAADAEARYAQNRYLGKPGRVPAVGTKRRLQALHALGWTWTALAAELGTSRSAVEKWANEPRAFMYASTAARVSGVYERLCMTRPEGWMADRTRAAAKRRGHLPPLVWDDIDDPDEQPQGIPAEAPPIDLDRARRQNTPHAVDPTIVARILDGEHLPATRAERLEVLARWVATGRSQNELERIHGWHLTRDKRLARANDEKEEAA